MASADGVKQPGFHVGGPGLGFRNRFGHAIATCRRDCYELERVTVAWGRSVRNPPINGSRERLRGRSL
jgi:hypothetical protein